MGNVDGTSFFWDVQTNGIARTFPAWGSAVRFTANGKVLGTVNGPLVNLWRVATGTLLASYDTAPDGTVVLARMPVTVGTNLSSSTLFFRVQSLPNP